jgi:hypothetical protein
MTDKTYTIEHSHIWRVCGGWYYSDEAGGMHGPYERKESAEFALKRYVLHLETGE